MGKTVTNHDINIEKIKSINHWMRDFVICECDNPSHAEWLLDFIKGIIDSKEWTCMPEHEETGLMRERQIAYAITKHQYIPKIYREVEQSHE